MRRESFATASMNSGLRVMIIMVLLAAVLPAIAPAGFVDPAAQATMERARVADHAAVLDRKARIHEGRLGVLQSDEIPGESLGPSPVTGGRSDAGGDWVDVFSVELTEGQIFEAHLTGTLLLDEWAWIEGFAPDADSVYHPADYFWFYGADGASMHLTIHAESTGVYYVAVWGESGTYSLEHAIIEGTPDDFIPGMVLPPSPVSGSLALSGDTRDIYSLSLEGGQLLRLSLDAVGSIPTMERPEFYVEVYEPDTEGLLRATSIAETWDWTSSIGAIEYLVPPDGGGIHYVAIRNYGGLGDYTLSWSVDTSAVHRLAGESRYATSIAISRSTFASSEVAVLATGAGYPDALSASALAGALDAPLLLVRDNVNSGAYWDMVRELERLGVNEVYVVGGTAAISSETALHLRDERGFGLKRLGGGTRYETARAVAEEVVRIKGGADGAVEAVFLARGDDFADALAAAPYAFSQAMPVLLTRGGSLDPLAAAFIEENDILDVTVVGGAVAVSAEVESAAKALNDGATAVVRVAGASRYETAAALARHAVESRAWASWELVGVATGRSFPDALSGSTAAGRRGGVLLLTGPSTLSAPAAAVMGGEVVDVVMALVFGGPTVVSDAVLEQLHDFVP